MKRFNVGDEVRSPGSAIRLTVWAVRNAAGLLYTQEFTTKGSSVWLRSDNFELIKPAELNLEVVVDMINHPEHYKSASGIECIDVVESMTFNRGNAIKYIWRAGEKGGPDKAIEDLRKAAWYVQREIERIAAKSVKEADR